jgi:hypothetical protein
MGPVQSEPPNCNEPGRTELLCYTLGELRLPTGHPVIPQARSDPRHPAGAERLSGSAQIVLGLPTSEAKVDRDMPFGRAG